ncbi:MAG TPA: FtsQ-type POTRA domain-containing protein [Ilumatobacteraceae bacterium]|nr:FtsQ-type POTRA domain-containing protein [Ilumatobacteraceae bacterium]
MAWRRRSRPEEPTDSGDAPGNELHPDVVVLDELSRVFAVDATDTPDHDGSDEHGPDPSEPDDDSPADRSPPDGSPADDAPGGPDADRSGSGRVIIAIGGDDDLPDAMYLDDELADESGSGPVFIDDDGSSDALMPKDATTHGIEPRLRQRRIGVRRAASRKRLWWALLGGIVLVVVIAALAVLGSSWFAVDEVSVTGDVYTDADELAAVVDDLRGTPVLRVDTDEIEARIEEIAWVESARVTTRFPDSASIEIKERTPVVSMLGSDQRSRVLDADGRVLAVIDGQPVALVWISGPGTLDLIPGDFAPIGYSSAASLVTKLTPNVRSRVESMLVTPDGSDLVLILTSPTGPIEVRFGSAIGDNAQIEKLVRLERKLADIGDDPVSVIDVSTAEVTVR